MAPQKTKAKHQQDGSRIDSSSRHGSASREELAQEFGISASILESQNHPGERTRTHLCTNVFPCQKVCFLVVLTLFHSKHIQYKGVYVMSSALSSNNNRSTGFRISSDEITAYSIQYTFK